MTERFFKTALCLMLALGLVLVINLACPKGDDDDDDDTGDDDDDDDDDAAEQACEDDYEADVIACVTAGSLQDIALCQIDAAEDLGDCLLAAGALPQTAYDCIMVCLEDARGCVTLCGENDYDCINACTDTLSTCYNDCDYSPPDDK